MAQRGYGLGGGAVSVPVPAPLPESCCSDAAVPLPPPGTFRSGARVAGAGCSIASACLPWPVRSGSLQADKASAAMALNNTIRMAGFQ